MKSVRPGDCGSIPHLLSNSRQVTTSLSPFHICKMSVALFLGNGADLAVSWSPANSEADYASDSEPQVVPRLRPHRHPHPTPPTRTKSLTSSSIVVGRQLFTRKRPFVCRETEAREDELPAQVSSRGLESPIGRFRAPGGGTSPGRSVVPVIPRAWGWACWTTRLPAAASRQPHPWTQRARPTKGVGGEGAPGPAGLWTQAGKCSETGRKLHSWRRGPPLSHLGVGAPSAPLCPAQMPRWALSSAWQLGPLDPSLCGPTLLLTTSPTQP